MKKTSTFLRTLQYVKPYALTLIASLSLALIYSIATLLIPFFIGRAIDLLAYGPINKEIYTNFIYIGISIFFNCVNYTLYIISEILWFIKSF